MKKGWKQFWMALIIVVVLLSGTVFAYLFQTTQQDSQAGLRDEQPQEVTGDEREQVQQNEEPQAQEKKSGIVSKVIERVERKTKEIQDEYFAQANVVYDVPFTSQAPYGNWEPPYDEACEEASMLMVFAFFNNQELNQQKADASILKQVAWQEENGYAIDLTAAETQEVLRAYFEIDSELVYEPTIEDIQKALDAKSLVIVPAAGRLLENPYFTPPGPLYHMFVITGYDNEQKEFITNDPGTRRGDGFRYSYQNIMESIHDWNGGDVLNGQKVMIVVPKQ